MKVLAFSHDPFLFGAQLMLLDLVRCARDEYVVVCPERGPLTDALSQIDGCRVIILKRPTSVPGYRARKLARRLPYLIRLVRLIRQQSPDLVYVNTIAHTAPVFAGWLSRTPVLVNVMESRSFFERSPSAYLRILALRFLATRVIGVARAIADIIALHGVSRSRIEIVHCGVDADRYLVNAQAREHVRAGLGVGRESLVVGMVGSVIRRKGVEVFVSAAGIASRASHDVHFVVVGECRNDEYGRSVRSLVSQLGLTGRIHFVGYQPDIAAWLGAFDIFVNASLEEPFSRVTLEAMATGLPVVVSDVDGSAEAVEHGVNGMLFGGGDREALAGALTRVLLEPDTRERLGRQARLSVSTKFTLERYCEEVSAVARASAR